MTVFAPPEDEILLSLIEARATNAGTTTPEAAQSLFGEAFHGWIESLHQRFMAGEISQGHMAELLGISRIDLIHTLEALDLQVTNL